MDGAPELQPISDLLECLGVTRNHQYFIIDVIESHMEAWEQMQLEQRSFALRSTVQILKHPADMNRFQSAKHHFESCFPIP